MIDVLNNDAISIRVEAPGEDGAEFYLERGSIREYWQTKRQITGQATWTFVKLRPVLEYFFEKYKSGGRCVFASVSDAPELRMLTENAQAAKAAGEDLDQFKEKYLNGSRTIHFTELREFIGASSDNETFDFLCAITVHGGREITLEPEFAYRLSVMFRAPWQATMAALRELYLRSTHETLNASQILQHLITSKIEKRRDSEPDVRDRVLRITDSYLEGQRAKLIRKTSIFRPVAADVVKRISSSTSSLDFTVSGPAGGGKSGCLLQIVEELQRANCPVIAFRLDSLPAVSSTIALGAQLGLHDSPAIALSAAFANQTVVLVIDQLDCVSTTSGRNPAFFDTIAALRSEVLALRRGQTIHFILACRKFDLEHDFRIRHLVSKQADAVQIPSFTQGEVAQVIEMEGGDISRLTSSQQLMLCLPQNLSLFVESGLAQSKRNFSTPKELCDAYWIEKRRAVVSQNSTLDQHWMGLIETLARTMSERQELSVPAPVVDRFPQELLDRMTSEGVLRWDGKRYGFGHETFFDYCFARTLPNGGRDFVAYLQTDAQHLFRRAQLRQVLAFLRDDDASAYLASVAALLSSEKIRPHLKILAVELIASAPTVTDEELQLLLPAINSELHFRQIQQPNPEKLSSRIFDNFFSSSSLFEVADRLRMIESWMNSGKSQIQDLTIMYLRRHLEHHANRIAELVEPYADAVDWRARLRYLMEGRHLEISRRYFDLFLRLLANGALDGAKDRFASNGTFWSMLYGFGEKRPAWCAELAARWFERHTSAREGETHESTAHKRTFRDGFEGKELLKSAQGDPFAFLTHVLPVVIAAANKNVYEGNSQRLRLDKIWPTRFRTDHSSMPDVILEGCEVAFRKLGVEQPSLLKSSAEQLASQHLYTANHLLLTIYASAPQQYADECLKLLANEEDRLVCGFADSAYWQAREAIEKCSPYCAIETFAIIENTLLRFVPPYERTKDGRRSRGRASYNLLSGLDQIRTSAIAKTRIEFLRDKFKSTDGPPTGVRVYSVGSPIQPSAASLMTDEQWLRAMTKYDNDERENYHNPEIGGATQLAQVLQQCVEKDPQRFAQVALQIPEDSNPTYLAHILRGIQASATDVDTKLKVAARAFRAEDRDCIMSALELLSTISGSVLPDDAITFIEKVARHNDPEIELWDGESPYYGGDMLSHGINCVRGRAAGAIRNLIIEDPVLYQRFSSTIADLVKDSSLAVRASVAYTLLAAARMDLAAAISWCAQLFQADDRLLATVPVQELIHLGVRQDPMHFREILERMQCSPFESVREAGGALSCLAGLQHHEAAILSERSVAGDLQNRLGACDVARKNIATPESRDWCEIALLKFFEDENSDVRDRAANCFWYLWQSPETPLSDFNSLIRGFLTSPSFPEQPTYLLHALEETNFAVPDATLDVCEAFVRLCAEDARDIRTAIAADEQIVGKLVFTSYAQLRSNDQHERALNVIDQMILEGLQSVNSHFANFER